MVLSQRWIAFIFLFSSFLSLPDFSYGNDFLLLFASQELHSENPCSSTCFMVSNLNNSLIIQKKGETLEQELPCLETKDMVTTSVLEVDQVTSLATVNEVTE